jgi:hypothetical protein
VSLVESLHVITACTRPGNLGIIAASLSGLRQRFGVTWHVVFSDRSHPDWWGGWERNQALVLIPPTSRALVWCLDDDTTCHPGFAAALAEAVAGHPDAAGFVFGQVDARGKVRLRADADAKVGGVDAGSFVFRRSAVGDVRFGPSYESDGRFFEAVRGGLGPGAVVTIDRPVTIHNALAGV